MKIMKVSLIAAAVLALGFALCPAPPGARRVDPKELLRKALNTDRSDQSPTSNPQISLIEKNYTPLVEGEDTVAGMPVWTLRLKPSRKHFPWKQLWIDKQTGAVLASRDWTGRNKIRSSVETTADSHNSAQLSGEKLDVVGPSCRRTEDPHVALRTARRLLGRTVLLPGYVPECFELASVEVDNTGGDVHLVYSDGLYALSVFVGPMADRAARSIRVNRAYDWGQGLAFLTHAQGRSALIVADLPVEEIEKIAGSVQ